MDMAGKVCLVTGSNSGIGKETAFALAEMGATVIMVVRNEEKGQKAFNTENKGGKKKTVVIPNRCVVFCRGCKDICPAGALSHLNEEKTQKIIDQLKAEARQ